jgi:hypothetical protein
MAKFGPFLIFLDLATLHQILLHNIAGLAATRMASSQQQEQQQQQQLFRVRENMYITCLRGKSNRVFGKVKNKKV